MTASSHDWMRAGRLRQKAREGDKEGQRSSGRWRTHRCIILKRMMRTSNISSVITGLMLAILMVLAASDGFAQRIYDGTGRYIGRVDNDRYYDGSGRFIGRIEKDRVYDGSGRNIGRIERGRIYDGTGRNIGRVDGSRLYDSSGRNAGRIDGNRVYDSTGRFIARAEGLTQQQIVIILLFLFFNVRIGKLDTIAPLWYHTLPRK